VTNPALIVRPYRPTDREAWLELMADLCVDSTAWEALYLEHPPFPPDFDLVAVKDGKIVGCLGGHLIHTDCKPFWSVEILGVHPEARKSGVGNALLKFATAKLRAHADRIVLWTRCREAGVWYLEHGYRLIDRRALATLPLADGELHALKSSDEDGCPLWAYAGAL